MVATIPANSRCETTVMYEIQKAYTFKIQKKKIQSSNSEEKPPKLQTTSFHTQPLFAKTKR